MKNQVTDYRIAHADIAALFLRLVFGGMFIYHGYPKLFHYHQMRELFGDPIGIGTDLSLGLVIFAEFFCGIFIVAGFLTRLSVVPIFITMAVAYFVAHAADPFVNKMMPFLYMLLCIPLFILGSGRYSVDKILTKPSPGNRA